MIASAVLARLAVDALVEAGVTHVVLCPGSRSAPLAYALHEREARAGVPALLVRHDERVAAFVALGVGRGGGLGAVVTTSGTAAAHLLPAVLEAHHAGVPLVVVTADRPPTLRGTWANQTTELQAGLYGGAVRARLDLPDAGLEDATAREDARTRIVEAVTRARGTQDGDRPGPVHLDLGLTEPLLPDPDEEPSPAAVPPATPGAATGSGSPSPGGHPVAARANAPAAVPASRLSASPRTVVVAGDGAGPAARELAERAGWPLLAEPSSGARGGGNAVAAYRLLLELPELGGRVQRVVAFGRPTLSRPVTALIAREDVEVVVVAPSPAWPGPARAVTRAVAVEPAAQADPRTDAGAGASDWLAQWRAAGEAARTALDDVLDEVVAEPREPHDGAGPGDGRTLPGLVVAREIAAALRPGETLLAAASNPVRDLDLAAPIGPQSLPCRSNRGLSGIDGTLSTAFGIALATGAPVRVLVGDVAFLHDAGALLLAPGEPAPAVQVVVLNDRGGGIFSLLEQGERAGRSPADRAAFERLFGTPQDVDLAALCAAYRVPYRLASTPARLRQALTTPTGVLEVVEVPASREGLRDLHAGIRSAVHSAARAALERAVVAAP